MRLFTFSGRVQPGDEGQAGQIPDRRLRPPLRQPDLHVRRDLDPLLRLPRQLMAHRQEQHVAGHRDRPPGHPGPLRRDLDFQIAHLQVPELACEPLVFHAHKCTERAHGAVAAGRRIVHGALGEVGAVGADRQPDAPPDEDLRLLDLLRPGLAGSECHGGRHRDCASCLSHRWRPLLSRRSCFPRLSGPGPPPILPIRAPRICIAFPQCAVGRIGPWPCSAFILGGPLPEDFVTPGHGSSRNNPSLAPV